jgi:hypothetical protein
MGAIFLGPACRQERQQLQAPQKCPNNHHKTQSNKKCNCPSATFKKKLRSFERVTDLSENL